MAEALANVPLSVLANLPALTPPPGVTSNFVDPESRAPGVIAACSVFLALAVIAYAMRLYTRFCIVHKPYWDDLTCGLGLIFTIINYAGLVLGTTKGPFGKHQWDVSLAEVVNRDLPISTFLQSMSWSFAQGFVKLAFFFLYFRIFWPFRWLRVSVYIGASLTAAFYLGFAIADIVVGTPKAHQTWVTHYLSPEEKMVGTMNIPLCAVGLVIDLFLFFLPVKAVWSLQLSRTRKIGVIATFATGLLACAISAASLGLRVHAEKSADQFWTQILVELFAKLEMLVGIIAVCMPVISPFFLHDLSPVKRLSSAVSSRTNMSFWKSRSSSFDDMKTESGHGTSKSSGLRGTASSKSELDTTVSQV